MLVDRCSIALAQLNTCVGDLDGNAQKILEAAVQAQSAGATLLLTPELSLSGYSLHDLVNRDDFLNDCSERLGLLAQELFQLAPQMAVIVGYPERVQAEEKCPDGLTVPKAYNSAAVLFKGGIWATHRKQALPNYSVFDERRVFKPGNQSTVFEFHGIRFGLLICEDVWVDQPINDCIGAGADILLVINASPWYRGKKQERLNLLQRICCRVKKTIVYCNQVGAQDELIFDGSSCVLDAKGDIKQQSPSFLPALSVVEFKSAQPLQTYNPFSFENRLDCADNTLNDLYQALCLGVRDYVQKSGFSDVILGLSGGVDSALTLAIAVDALGKEHVRAVMLPSPFTLSMSLEDAEMMAKKLNVRYDVLPIESIFQQATQSLEPLFDNKPADITEENLQARIRGVLLMALSNKHAALLLTTGNKSEMAVGYATLYGDMCGALAVLKDLTKKWVYALCSYRNRLGRVIPERILTRAPSAELRFDQTDQDTLPPYNVLDAIIEGYVENGESVQSLVTQGFDKQVVERVVRLIRLNEYKRQQSPVGLKVTRCAFGKDWRFPIVNKRFN
ncbi:MAG: NAD+ synthase [Pseudomonadota bacterium]